MTGFLAARVNLTGLKSLILRFGGFSLSAVASSSSNEMSAVGVFEDNQKLLNDFLRSTDFVSIERSYNDHLKS